MTPIENKSTARLSLPPAPTRPSSPARLPICPRTHAPLLPRDRRKRPSGDKYVMSSQPLRSSPNSLKGTGYGTLKGRALKVKAAV